MWIDDIAEQLNKFRKPSQYCKTMKHRGSNLKDGTVDIDIVEGNQPPKRLCRVICISIDVRRYKELVLANAGSIFVDEFMPDIRHGEKWLNGYTWRANTLWTTFSRYTYETRGVVEKRYWSGNPYSRYVPPLYEQYNIDTTELKPGALLVGKDYVVTLATPCDELREQLLKENPTASNEINKEWQSFLEGEFTADSNYDIIKEQPKGYGLHWVFRVCDTYIGVYRDNNTDDLQYEDIEHHKYWIATLPRDYATKQHTIYCFDFNNFVKGGNMVLKSDKVTLQVLKCAIAYRKCAFKDANSASIVETMYMSL